jgi:FkbM family methyltransferase
MHVDLSEKLSRIVSSGRNFFQPATRFERFTLRPLHSTYVAAVKRLNRFFGSSLNLTVRAKTFWGDMMRVPLPDGAPIFLWGFIDGEELNLTKFLVDTLKPGNIFFDVGAYVGYYSVLASVLVGEKGQVHAFEPTPRSFAILERNTKTKRNIITNHQALWCETRAISFIDFGPERGVYNCAISTPRERIKSAHENLIQVPAITLDRYCIENSIRPNFIKLDAEGAEYHILMGARNILKSRPILSIELWGGGRGRKEYQRLFDLLKGYHYAPYRLIAGNPTPFKMGFDFDFVNLIWIPAAK